MAGIIQVLLLLVAVALAEAQLPQIPFFDNIPGLPHPPRHVSDGPRDSRIAHNNVGYNSGYNTWFQHFGHPDAHQFSFESHESDKSYENFDPFFQRDPYFQGNFDHMPGINNMFNIPNPSYNSHRHQSPLKGNNPQEKPKQVHNGNANIQKPEEKHKEIVTADKKTAEQDKGPKFNEANVPDEQNTINEAKISDMKNNLNEANISDVKNKLTKTEIPDGDLLPPKTNAIKKDDEIGAKDDKQVDLDKNKDFLLIGQGNNGNNLYLLHENNPNPTTVMTPNANQPGNNIVYVPYNPAQTNNQVYQVVNGQPAPSNIQMTPDKLGVSNGYNNAVLNPGQSNVDLNAGSQNPGYVTIYSNGQLIQIPGVVVNSAPNSAPLQNVNQGQGTNYIIANAVPNNVQTVPAIQNPGSNMIYAAIPNQPSNGPIYVQVPHCINTVSNGCGSGVVLQNPVQGVNNDVSNNGLPSNVFVYQVNPNTVAQPAVFSNGVSNGYVQANMVGNQGQGVITVAIPNNPNVQYQPAVQMPVSSGSNGYSQPIVLNLGQGQNAPNQGGTPVDSYSNGYNQPILSNQGQLQNLPNQKEKQEVSYQGPMMNNNQPTFQPAAQMPVNSGTNGYNQPILSNLPQGPNASIQGAIADNQNMLLQTAVVIPISSGYGHNLMTNPIVNVETRDEMSSNQNEPSQSVAPASGGTNDQGTNAIVNTPSNTEVINQESDITKPLTTSSIVLDSNNLSSLGAQPAIMISDFKDKSGRKKDKKKSKDKKEKKEKKDNEKKKDKKSEDDDKSKDSEPFTNKKD